MSKQIQQPSVQGTSQSARGQSQQYGGGVEQSQFSRPSLQKYKDTMPSEFRVALHDFNALAEVADWCRDQCLDKEQMATVVRTCEDLTDVAALNEKLVVHDSVYGPHVAEAFLKVAQKSLDELRQYEQDPAVAETVPVVERAIESTEKLLASVGWQSSATQQVGQQSATTQQVGQQRSRQVQQFQRSTQPQQSRQFRQQSRYGTFKRATQQY